MEEGGAGPRVVEAAVWMGGQETAYRRAGDGPPILLLVPAAGGQDGVFAALAAEFRVIAPLRLPSDEYAADTEPAGEAPERWEAWLRGLIDGLGLGRPPLVVEAALVPEVERCARLDPGRIRAVLRAAAPAEELLAELRAVVQDD